MKVQIDNIKISIDFNEAKELEDELAYLFKELASQIKISGDSDIYEIMSRYPTASKFLNKLKCYNDNTELPF